MKSIGNLLLRNFYMKIIKVVNFYIQCEIQNLVCSACVVLFYICDRQYYFCSQYFNIAKNCFQNSKNHHKSIGCSFKFILKVGVEESIVNAPLASLQNENKQRKK
jgi:hypothetical protein